jgi:uncharacterized protein (DUF885 family)
MQGTSSVPALAPGLRTDKRTMRTIILGLLVTVVAACAPGTSEPRAADPRADTAEARLGALKTSYLEQLFRAKPHLATFMGDHRFDDKVVDLSPGALAAREQELVAQQGALAKIDRTKLTLDDQIDAQIMGDGIALELLYLREIRDYAWDPRLNDSFPYYDPREIVGERLGFLMHGDYATEADRRGAAAAELRGVPMLVAQKKAVLGAVSKVCLDQAVQDNKGMVAILEGEVKEFTKSDAAAEAARAQAVAALRDYQSFLEKDLPARATHDWRLGEAVYRKKFPLALQTRLTPEEVIPRAEDSFRGARADLYAASRRLWPHLFAEEPVPAETDDPASQAKLIERTKNELSKSHPAAPELVAAHAANLDRLRAFIEKHDLLTLPPKETLSVVEMPLFKRGSVAAEYIAPGVLDKSKPGFHANYYVDPVDTSWSPERIESYMRANNRYEVELTAAHEAYPGHHTQFSYERKDLNPLRATLWNGAMVEGWAVYAEGLLVRLGYGDANNDAYRFFDARGRMIVATNIILDIKLQTGKMTDDEAVRFMVKEGFQEQAQAEKKLVRAKLDSTQLAQYWLGSDEIVRLEKDYRKKVGDKFLQRAFDEALITHGSIAVEHLRSYLLGG